MKLQKVVVKNFRKLNDVEILLDDSTFLIGANNAGKTSTLDAIEILLSERKLDASCRSQHIDSDAVQTCLDDVIIEGEFTEVPIDIIGSRGFNVQRLFKYTKEDGTEAYSFRYRVRLSSDDKSHREIRLHNEKLKSCYESAKTYQDFIDAGADSSLDFFSGKDLTKKLTASDLKALPNDCPSLYEVEESEEWFENPGGIASNVISVLPKFLKIKADILENEVGSSGTLHDILSVLFEQVRDKSQNYRSAVESLQRLQKELDPQDKESDFGKLMTELNKVVDNVFPTSSIDVTTDLSKPESLKPQFTVMLNSNISTDVAHQGTGLVRSVVFALLKFNQQWREANTAAHPRSLIIGFEEPELFLHPNAVNNMRNIIYELASNDCQIISTTHSPYMIDLSKTVGQIYNSYSIGEKQFTNIFAFNHSKAFNDLMEDDRSKIKMLQKIDEYVSRVFFAQKAIIVEGDTECVVFKKTIEVMPESARKQISDRYQIIKASGKAVIISLVKYLIAMNVDVFVVHDEDSSTPGAVIMNQPILDALKGDTSKRLMLHNCIEDVLGYSAPSSEKPFNAYQHIKDWSSWDDVPQDWKNVMKKVFSDYAAQL